MLQNTSGVGRRLRPSRALLILIRNSSQPLCLLFFSSLSPLESFDASFFFLFPVRTPTPHKTKVLHIPTFLFVSFQFCFSTVREKKSPHFAILNDKKTTFLSSFVFFFKPLMLPYIFFKLLSLPHFSLQKLKMSKWEDW